jgi:MFS family permease
MAPQFPLASLTTLQHRWLMPVLVFATLVLSVVSVLGAPLIPTIAEAQGISLETAQWILTGPLMIGAVLTPLVGRLADGQHRKAVIVATIGLVALGGVICATVTWFPVFIVGRGLMGAGLGIVPMAISVARDFLSTERSRNGIALLSISTPFGVGAGYPITGAIAELGSYQVAYWFSALVSLIAIAMIVKIVPAASPHTPRRLDVTGAVLLGIALVGLLLAISQGRIWGWTSAPTLLSLAAGVVFGGLWAWWELRIPNPLVELRLARHPLVMSSNIMALLLGVSLQGISSLVNRFIQSPPEAGYGMHAGLILTGFILMPSSFGTLASNFTSRWLHIRVGAAIMMPIGVGISGLTALMLAVERDSALAIGALMLVNGFGISTAFAAMPSLILQAVPPHETGSATGLNTVLRAIGGATGSAASIAVLSTSIPAGGAVPTDHGYTLAFLAGAVAGAVAVVLSLGLTWRARRKERVETRAHVIATPAGDHSHREM